MLGTAALFWGFAFAFQTEGTRLLGPYSFNCIRMLIGALVVIIMALILGKTGFSKRPKTREERKRLWMIGGACGFFLFLGSNLQQAAISLGATAGKAGFLTAMYILIVPVIGIFFKRKPGWNVWIAVFIATAGFYFLCINGDFSFKLIDILLLLCALAYSAQIMILDRWGPGVDSLWLSAVEFIVCGVLTLLPSLFLEIIPYKDGLSAYLSAFSNSDLWICIMYMAIFSCGFGYTFQVIGQREVDPTVASLLMSQESIFSAVAGWTLLNQKMSGRELIGCALMCAALVLAQLKFNKTKRI